MNVKLLISQPVTSWWHAELARRVRAAGHDVHFCLGPGATVPAAAVILRRLEDLVRRRPAGAPGDVPVEPIAEEARAADVTIDLTGACSRRGGLLLAPLCDGVPGYAGLYGALLEGRSPELAVLRVEAGSSEGRIVACGRAAIHHPKRLGVTVDAINARLCDLLWSATCRPQPGNAQAATRTKQVTVSLAAVSRFAIASATRHFIDKVERLVRRPDHWSVGWRRVSPGDAVSHHLAWPPDAPFNFVPDDGNRYYADPFPFVRDGVTWMFLEEFPYVSRKGIISACSIDSRGTVSAPRPVLEAAYHLSYPQVFEQDGTVWMIPESSANRTIELYRAKRFPDEWVREAVLLADLDASDATLVKHDGRLWLFAAVHGGVASSRDALGLFHAPALTGPWQAHPLNPVLVDAAAARPAGAMFRHGGDLYRPAQDCTLGYGSGLSLCRVKRLDVEGYEQTTVARLRPPAAWRAKGVHTLNSAGDIEVVDRVRSIGRF